MHGTFVNGSQLPSNSPTELQDNDSIVLGAEVRRGHEMIPACAFQLKYHLMRYNPPRPDYSFPDMSDMDDEGVFEFSDLEDEVEHNSNDGISVASSRPNLSGSSKMIDLTGDDSSDSSDSSSVHSADLTHVSESKSDTEEVVMGSRSANPVEDHNPSVRAIGEYYCIEEEEEEERVDNDRSIIHVDDDSDETSDSEEEEDEENREEVSDQEDSQSISDVSDDDDDMSMAGSEYSIRASRVVEVPSSMIYDEELHSEESNQESVAADVERDDNFAPLPSIKKRLETLDTYGLPETCPSGVATAEAVEAISSFKDQYKQPSPPSDACQSSNNVSTNPQFLNRAPSPSDVLLPRSKQWPSHISRWSPSGMTSKTLGAGTGKEEFFKARAENRATFTQNTTIVQNTMDAIQNNREGAPDNSRRILKLKLKAPHRKSTQQAEDNADILFDHEVSEVLQEFDTMEDIVDLFSDRDIAGRLPDTAVIVNSSNTTQAADVHRPLISIDDIINKATPEIIAPVTKRKADEISTTLEEEARAWASTPCSASDILTAQDPVPVVTVFTGVPSSQQVITERPQKRLRRVMERMGYAALGGIAVGAALFGGLVATAPEFV